MVCFVWQKTDFEVEQQILAHLCPGKQEVHRGMWIRGVFTFDNVEEGCSSIKVFSFLCPYDCNLVGDQAITHP